MHYTAYVDLPEKYYIEPYINKTLTGISLVETNSNMASIDKQQGRKYFILSLQGSFFPPSTAISPHSLLPL